MRIVDRKTFLEMPAGTVFSKYDPHILRETMIKGDTVAGVDFYYSDMTSVSVPNRGEWTDVMDALERGENVPMDFEMECRDGCFDHEQLFAVWDAADVEALTRRLQGALKLNREEGSR